MSTAKQILCVLGQEMERLVTNSVTAWPCAASVCGQRSPQREDGRGEGNREQNSTTGDTMIGRLKANIWKNSSCSTLCLCLFFPNASITKGLSESPLSEIRSHKRALRMWRAGKGLELPACSTCGARAPPVYSEARNRTAQRIGFWSLESRVNCVVVS